MSTAVTTQPGKTFFFEDRLVRFVMRDGAAWFVAADVCTVLGLANPRTSLALLDADEKGVHSVDTPGGAQSVTVVNEPGLYSLILRSRKPQARAFKRWVTHEVLPAIRRTGGYTLPGTLADALELAAAQQRRLDATRAELAEAEPKVAAFDTYMDADGAVPMGAVANHLGIGRTTLFRRLRAAGILQRQDNRPYQRYAHHFTVVAHTVTDHAGIDRARYTTLVRPTGVELIRRTLAEPNDPVARTGQVRATGLI